ncbi:hypothetical protein GP486_007535 [Trichoglossum hirsutum]|uniref:mRNA N(6)-methyladenine demethylase n=1 Tax=Trichoglossum hirsutum TaxID=265104 RepID=A0A9P8ICK5_9PEZI|nr:hypothetical protein GP486_007535 [Trichoglossum hirsutum]
MATALRLDAHEAPPIGIRHEYKKYQKLEPRGFDEDLDIIDFQRGLTRSQDADVVQIGAVSAGRLAAACQSFHQAGKQHMPTAAGSNIPSRDIPIYQHGKLPGLHMLPSLLPPNTQLALLSRLLHRDLSNPKHKTNIHAHHQVVYCQAAPPSPASEAQDEPPRRNITSFFNRPPSSSEVFPPKDSTTHKPLRVSQFLQSKLRWMTLGGQYDWTMKEYPPEPPPPFPVDIANLLHSLFPDMKAQAAIVNLYSPGDTLSVHRDVSEECDRGLVSISLGCDCIFIVGLEEEKGGQLDSGETGRRPRSEAGSNSLLGEGTDERVDMLAIRLRSGDAVYMSGRSRFAWHGVPKIIPATCPGWMQEWPAQPQAEDGAGGVEAWRGWMASKRVNVNVRQMWE